MWIEKTTKTDLSGNQNDAVYTIDLKACNPGCGGSWHAPRPTARTGTFPAARGLAQSPHPAAKTL